MPDSMTKLPFPARATEAIARKMDETMTKLPVPRSLQKMEETMTKLPWTSRATEVVVQKMDATITKLPVARHLQKIDETMTKWVPRATGFVGRNIEKVTTVAREVSPISSYDALSESTLHPGAGPPSKLTTKEIMFWIIIPTLIFLAMISAIIIMHIRARRLKEKDEESRIAEVRKRYLNLSGETLAPGRVFQEVPVQEVQHFPAAN